MDPPRQVFATAARLWRAATAASLTESDDAPPLRRTYLDAIPAEIRAAIGQFTAPELYASGIEPPRVTAAAITIPHYELDGHRLAILPSMFSDTYVLQIYIDSVEARRMVLTSPLIAISAAAILARGETGNIIYLARRTYDILRTYPSPGRALLSASPHGELLYYPNILQDLASGRETTVSGSDGIRVCDEVEYTKKSNSIQLRIGRSLLARIPARCVLRYDYPMVTWNGSYLQLHDNRGKTLMAQVPCETDLSMGRATLENGILIVTTSSHRLEFALRIGQLEHRPKSRDALIRECRAACHRHVFRDDHCSICGSWAQQYY